MTKEQSDLQVSSVNSADNKSPNICESPDQNKAY